MISITSGIATATRSPKSYDPLACITKSNNAVLKMFEWHVCNSQAQLLNSASCIILGVLKQKLKTLFRTFDLHFDIEDGTLLQKHFASTETLQNISQWSVMGQITFGLISNKNHKSLVEKWFQIEITFKMISNHKSLDSRFPKFLYNYYKRFIKFTVPLSLFK